MGGGSLPFKLCCLLLIYSVTLTTLQFCPSLRAAQRRNPFSFARIEGREREKGEKCFRLFRNGKIPPPSSYPRDGNVERQKKVEEEEEETRRETSPSSPKTRKARNGVFGGALGLYDGNFPVSECEMLM